MTFTSSSLLLAAALFAPVALAAGDGPAIHDIQGAGHHSPLDGYVVIEVRGVVTAVGEDVFWMTAPEAEWDQRPQTSEGLRVDIGSLSLAPPGVGDLVEVDGAVKEHVPGGVQTNLPTTTLRASAVRLLGSGHPVPPPILLGKEGRSPPDRIVDDDELTDFEPRTDGIDFFESLEGMLVRVDGARCVGPRTKYGEIPVLCDDGRSASGLSPEGMLVLSADDAQPERIVLDDLLVELPAALVGDRLGGRVVGVLDYSFGAYKLLVTERVVHEPGKRRAERASDAPEGSLRVATFNVENLAPTSGPDAFARLAEQIVDALRSPDLIGVQEIQDDDGPACSGDTSAEASWTLLVEAIEAAGGPHYRWADVAPEDGADGGQPCGNIRVGFLWREDTGLSLVHRPGAAADVAVVVTDEDGVPGLVPSPGRIQPTHTAWDKGRKSLAAWFQWKRQPLFVVVNHWKSKGGDTPVFGSVQPPVQFSQRKRSEQAQVVADFVDELLAVDPKTWVIVLGDLNDFPWSAPVRRLTARGRLVDLIEELPRHERWTYVYGGNAQVLDHVLVSAAVMDAGAELDVIHVNAAFEDPASDHDPCLATIGVGRD